jgi:hypothetical protein
MTSLRALIAISVKKEKKASDVIMTRAQFKLIADDDANKRLIKTTIVYPMHMAIMSINYTLYCI